MQQCRTTTEENGSSGLCFWWLPCMFHNFSYTHPKYGNSSPSQWTIHRSLSSVGRRAIGLLARFNSGSSAVARYAIIYFSRDWARTSICCRCSHYPPRNRRLSLGYQTLTRRLSIVIPSAGIHPLIRNNGRPQNPYDTQLSDLLSLHRAIGETRNMLLL